MTVEPGERFFRRSKRRADAGFLSLYASKVADGIHRPCEGWGYFTGARKGKNGVFRHGKNHDFDAAPPCFQKSAINLVNDDMTSGDPLRHP